MKKTFFFVFMILAIASLAIAAGEFSPYGGTSSKVGTLTNGKWCNSDGSLVNCTQDAPAGTGDVTGPASPTAGSLTKWGPSGKALVDGLKLGTLTDGKGCTYTTANGLVCTTNAAAVIDDTKGNGDTTYVWSADKVFDQLALKQDALTRPVTGPASPTANSLVKFTGTGQATDNAGVILGTMTDGDLCSYASSGTLLNCNTTSISGITTFVFPNGTSTAPTTEGSAYWNSTTDTLTIGDGAAAKAMAPISSPVFTSPSLGTSYLSTTKTAGTGGVTQYKLVKIDTDGKVITAATSDVGILGIAASTQSANASVEVATRGVISCVADNATTIGHLAIVGTSTAGACKDSGQTVSTAIDHNTQIVGKFITAVSGGAAASLQLYGPGHFGTQITERLGATFDGGGSALTSGKTVRLYTPFTGTISKWTILCDLANASTAATFDIYDAAFAVGTDVASTTALTSTGTKPSLATGTDKNVTGTPTGWTGTGVTAGDMIGIKLSTSPTSSTSCTVSLDITR